jgi:hypothetical protein
MGYACPVCEVPQRDAEHLANHLAFTAMLHGADHEAWLDEHAPAWSESSPAELAAVVAEHAAEAAYDEVFEDTVHGAGREDGGHGHGHGHAHAHERDHDHDHEREGGRAPGRESTGVGPGAPADAAGASAPEAPDGEAREVLREARELTRRMYEGEAEDERRADGSEGEVGDREDDAGGPGDDGGDDEGGDGDGDADADAARSGTDGGDG